MTTLLQLPGSVPPDADPGFSLKFEEPDLFGCLPKFAVAALAPLLVGAALLTVTWAGPECPPPTPTEMYRRRARRRRRRRVLLASLARKTTQP